MSAVVEDLAQQRGRRWWVGGPRVDSVERAAEFVEDVGFALLFSVAQAVAPSLGEAVAGQDDAQKVWAWKDELPQRGLAWYGKYLGGRGSLLSPALLAALYPGAGRPDDHEALPLSPAAHLIAGELAAQPLPSAELRTLVGDRNQYERAVLELQRALLVTTAGVHETRSGWPSAVLDLTCRRFAVGGRADHGLAARRFLDTMVVAVPAELARAFRWPVAQARARLAELAAAGLATEDGAGYRAVPVRSAG